MDAHAFDGLARTLATPASRRCAVGGMLAGTLALLSSEGEHASSKKKKPCPPCKKRKKGKCKGLLPDGSPCSGGTCQGGACQPGVAPTPPGGGCTPNCAGKSCGADDGCGNRCTRQQGCGTDQTCIDGCCVTTACSPACTSEQHCCDALGSGTLACWNCCEDQDCIDNPVFNGQGRIVCRSGGCNCPDELPALCPAGFGTAAQRCTDPRSDKRNCSPDPLICGAGCPNDPTWECCGGTCSFLPKCLNNTGGWQECQTPHCGVCGRSCLAEGFGCCNGSCVDMTQDPNCGICGRDCSQSGQTCDGGTCHVCTCEEG